MTNQAEPIPSTLPKLTDNHTVFCESYLVSWNATDAYGEAYPKAKYTTRRTNGSLLLANPNIRAYIDRRLSEMVMSSDEVLKRLSDMAKGSMLPFIEITSEGFVYFDFSDPEAKNYMHLIKRIKSNRTRRVDGGGKKGDDGQPVWEDERVEVELHDAFAALVQVGKYHKLFTENVDVTSGGKALPEYLPPSEIAARVAALLATKGKDGDG